MMSASAAGQHYCAEDVNSSNNAREAIPDEVVQMFRQTTFSIRSLVNYDDAVCSESSPDIVMDSRSTMWFTGIRYGQKYYIVDFNYTSYERRNESSNNQGYVEFTADTASARFEISALMLPARADTLPSKIQRVINGKVKRYCRRYNKQIDRIDAEYHFYNGKAPFVRCTVVLNNNDVVNRGDPDYNENLVRSFVITTNGLVRKLRSFRSY